MFSATVDIFKGVNWIAITGIGDATDGYAEYRTGMGISTDKGTNWTPPIIITSIADASSDFTPGLADMTADYGATSDWSAVVGSDSVITVNGKYKQSLRKVQ